MAITLDNAKEYLRIDSSAEDALLARLMLTSEAYLSGAIDNYSANKAYSDFLTRAEMVQLAIISDMYENRNNGGVKAEGYGRVIESLIRQLQNYEPPETESDAE